MHAMIKKIMLTLCLASFAGGLAAPRYDYSPSSRYEVPQQDTRYGNISYQNYTPATQPDVIVYINDNAPVKKQESGCSPQMQCGLGLATVGIAAILIGFGIS